MLAAKFQWRAQRRSHARSASWFSLLSGFLNTSTLVRIALYSLHADKKVELRKSIAKSLQELPTKA